MSETTGSKARDAINFVRRLSKEDSADRSIIMVVIMRTEEQHSNVVYHGQE